MSTLKEKLENFKTLTLQEKSRYICRVIKRKLAEIYRRLMYNNLTLPHFYKKRDKDLKEQDKDINFDVDAVYMWVDGDDPQIIQKRNKYLKLAGKEPTQEAIAKGRFFDNDELKYSLRSLEKYAPWIRHIYLITDNQVPKWLKETPKLTIVDHKDIIDEKYLPTFNSEVIDYNIHKIKGLADRFILINDDMFLGRKVYKSFFFNKDGKPIKYLRKLSRRKLYSPSNNMFFGIYKRCQLMIEEKFKQIPVTRFAHAITPYLKESFQEVIDLFPKDVERTLGCRFRTENDVSRFLVDHYEIAVKGAEIVDIVKFWNSFVIDVDMRDDTLYKFDLIEKLGPYMYCLNDTEHTTDADRVVCREFLDRVSPEKSSFEK